MAERARVYPLRREPSPEPRPSPEPSPEPVSKEPPQQERRPNQEPPQKERRPNQEPPQQEPLWREVLGQRLRALRLHQGETLAQTAGRAGISPQYLSEIERGRKEPSSEMIAALAGALATTLTGLTEQVAGDLRRQRDAGDLRWRRDTAAAPRPSGPVMLRLAA